MNNIVLRGFGEDSRIVTRGYGGIFEKAVKAARDLVRKTGSAAKDAKENLEKIYVVVRAAVKEVNGQTVRGSRGVDSGIIKASGMTVVAKVLFSRVYKGLREIFIRATNATSKRHRRD